MNLVGRDAPEVNVRLNIGVFDLWIRLGLIESPIKRMLPTQERLVKGKAGQCSSLSILRMQL
jgi:hypothetical protein